LASKFREKLNTWGTIVFGCLIAFGAISTAIEKLSGSPKSVAGVPANQGRPQEPQSSGGTPGENAAAGVSDAHPEDVTASNILKMPELWGQACDKLTNIKVVERLNGTASANNRPAHVVGVQFVCVTNFGNTPYTQYIGWMENTDTGRYECILHNQDRSKVVDTDAWYSCGGNLKLSS
jgi:hypothetical protein